MTQLTVHLFGPLEARLGEQSAPLRFPAQKTKSLLSYLLLHRGSNHPRERLATLWWGDHETAKAKHSLNTELWRLRQVLEPKQTRQAPFLTVGTDGIGFNTATDYWLDAEEFERLCARARQLEAQDPEAAGSVLQRAVALYRDDLLPDCYEDWCLIERQRLQQMYLFALDRLASFHARRKEYAQSIACCRQILACDPLREEVHRDLMRLYLAAARPNDALRQFKDCAAVLKRELGVEPMAETLALVRSLSPSFSHLARKETTLDVLPRPLDELYTSQELQAILSQLSVATEALTLAGEQVQNTLRQVEQLVVRLDGSRSPG